MVESTCLENRDVRNGIVSSNLTVSAIISVFRACVIITYTLYSINGNDFCMECWHITFWENASGVCLIERDLLGRMRLREKMLYRSLEEKMMRYTEVPIEAVRYQQFLVKVRSEVNMWELKFHLPKTEVRFLGCLTLESGISHFYALYAFRKKDQVIKDRHRMTARNRVSNFIGQYNQRNGLQKIL